MATFTGIFTELPVDSKLIIPPHKPPMECILGSSVEVDIFKKEVIDTPLKCTINNEIKDLQKVIIAGTVKIVIKYSALEPTQKVHAAHFEVPFCTLVEWCDGPPQGTDIDVDVIIEKEVFKKEDDRRIFKALLVRFDIYQ